ncbi:MAG TPA: hypothetical protein VHN82_04690 [Methanoregula sp.]|nr:hypothetical protein [Methanoregula sp.]
MEGAARVFAGEFNQSTLSLPSGDGGTLGWVVTPGGACCRQMYLTGVLTEVAESGDMVRCRVADPTGAFAIVSGGKNSPATQVLQRLSVPSFVTIAGYALISQKNHTCHVSVRPEQVREIDRAARDNLLLITAEYTISRLDQLHRAVAAGEFSDERVRRTVHHYGVTVQTLQHLAEMVDTAIRSVRSLEPPAQERQEDVRSVVMELIRDTTGPRGISVEVIIDTLAPRGIQKEAVLAALETLILDDDCYQPQKGYVKLL